MKIDIVSDVVCPWCYIGKRRLERALAQCPDLAVDINWWAFQLNPDMPPGGMERESYLAAKFGSAEQAEQIYAAITEAGVDEKIDFRFERIKRTPNTIDAHRLIRFAGEKGRQDELVEVLFRGYFEEGVDVGNRERLAEAAADAGLDADEVRAYLASGDGLDAVQIEDLGARRMGVTGVPSFIVDRQYAISGAQAPEVFLRVFETIGNADAAD